MKRTRGSSSDTTSGIKPEVAFQSEMLARENIEAKLRLMVTVLKNSATPELAARLPCSPRQFNLWAPVDEKGNHLTRNSNDTLNRHAPLLVSVQEATAAVRTARKLPVKAVSREKRIASLQRDVALNKTIREIAERALVKARTEALQARKDFLGLKSRMESLEWEAKEQRLNFEAEVSALRTENARLTKAMAKIMPIKKS